MRESVSVPVAGHECAQSMYDVLNVVKKDAADYLYLDGRFHRAIAMYGLVLARRRRQGYSVFIMLRQDSGLHLQWIFK